MENLIKDKKLISIIFGGILIIAVIVIIILVNNKSSSNDTVTGNKAPVSEIMCTVATQSEKSVKQYLDYEIKIGELADRLSEMQEYCESNEEKVEKMLEGKDLEQISVSSLCLNMYNKSYDAKWDSINTTYNGSKHCDYSCWEEELKDLQKYKERFC